MEKQKTKKKDFQSGFPECMGCSTRGRWWLPRVYGLQHSGKMVSSRVPGLWLSGKTPSSPSVWAAALGEEGFFPECCTRGRIFFLKKEGNDAGWSPTASILLRVIAQLSEKPSPSARFLALGEDVFPVKRYPGQSFLSVALGEGFSECIWAFPECIWH